MSLSCALWATSLHQWARRYIRRTQPSRCNPEKRARMRAFFAEGVDNMHIPWAVEGLPTLLHLSLFLFFGGLAIFLFNVDREVFSYVVLWIGLFCLVYGMITLLPLIRQDSPYNSPLSTPAWFLYATMTYLIMVIPKLVIPFCFKFLRRICFCLDVSSLGSRIRRIEAWMLTHIGDFGKYHRRWMLKGVGMAAEEAVSERLSKIDVSILDWTITTLGDDDSLKSFFEATPGFFDSKLVKHLEGDFPEELRSKYNHALNGFLDRTLSSNSVNDSEKLRRLDIFMNATYRIHHSVSSLIYNDKMHSDVTMARILVSVRERDDRWIRLAARVFGLAEQDLRENVALGDDSVLLAILIHVIRQSLRFYYHPDWEGLEVLSNFDIHNTLPRLQHDFCTLWNKIVQNWNRVNSSTILNPTACDFILTRIRHLYMALHQGTDSSSLTESPASTSTSVPFPPVPFPPISTSPVQAPFHFPTYHGPGPIIVPPSYQFCHIASHRPESTLRLSISTPHLSISTPPRSFSPPYPFIPPSPIPPPAIPIERDDSSDARTPSPPESDNTASRQAEQASNVIESLSSSNPTTTETGATSHPDMTPSTNSTYPSSRQSGASPTAVVATAPQSMCGSSTQNLTSSWFCTWCNCIRIPLFTSFQRMRQRNGRGDAPTPTTSLSYTPSGSYDTSVSSVSNSSYFTPPSVGSSILAPRSTGDATHPHLRARGLVNTGNMCFANAVLQVLVNLPPFFNMFRELGYLKGQRGPGVPETGGSATPLVDTTIRFFKEFMVVEESQLATGGTSANEEGKDESIVNSFEPTYMYDAMKEKRQLKPLLVRSRAHVAISY